MNADRIHDVPENSAGRSLLAETGLLLRRHTLILVIMIFAAPFYFTWTWNDGIGELGGDGANYLMMAQHYSPYRSANPAAAEAATFSRFPPLYPLVLAWLDPAVDLPHAHAATTACLMLALIALYAWLRREGTPAGQAALLVLLFAALPGSWLAGLSVQSEYLYLLLSLVALTLMAVYQRGGRNEALYAAALAVAAAVLTRTIGISLFAPLIVMLWRAPRRSGFIALTMAVLPLLAWHLLHQSEEGYGEALNSVYGGRERGALRTQLAAELPALRSGFGDNFLLTAHLRFLADALGLLALAGIVWRAVRLRPDGIYLVAYLTVLLVWPYPEHAQRFLWVLVPLLLAQPMLSIAEFLREPVDARIPRLITAASAGTMLLMVLPALALAADRYRSAAYTELPGARGFVSWYGADPASSERLVSTQVTIINAMRAIQEQVSASDCVIATRPDLVDYFGRRRSVFPPLNSVPDSQLVASLRQSGCLYVFGMSGTDSRFPDSLYPLRRLGPELEILYVSRLGEAASHRDQIIAALARVR